MRDFSPFALELRDCLLNIHKFSRQIMRFTPTWQQEELFKKIQFETFAPLDKTKKGIFVASGQGPGKTAATAVAATFRFLQRPKSLVLVTSPTKRQVDDIWMSEYARRVGQARPELQRMLDIQKTSVRVEGVDKWGIITATSNRPENVQGYHEDNLTVIGDEASGIGRPIWQTLKGTLTQPGNLLIGIGNPNDRDTEFFDAFNKDAELYHLLIWNAEESPNVDKKHLERMAAEYGRDSDTYRVRVLGLFPRESPDVVIRYEDLLYACRQRKFEELFLTPHPIERRVVRQFGLDLARFGSDESVVVARMGQAEVGKRWFSKREPADVIRDAFEWQREMGWKNDETVFCVDAGGMGQGVMHLFHESGRQVFEFHSGGDAFEGHRFRHAITEAYWNLRMMTRTRSLFLREDATTFNQLVSRRYKYQDWHGRNVIRLENKDEYMTRVGTEEYTSPDRADATALAFYPYASSPGFVIAA